MLPVLIPYESGNVSDGDPGLDGRDGKVLIPYESGNVSDDPWCSGDASRCVLIPYESGNVSDKSVGVDMYIDGS